MEQSEQIESLETAPPKDALKTREQAGRTLTYIEGHYVIATANRIFGPGQWNREFYQAGLELVHEKSVSVPQKNGQPRLRYDVAYICQYRITIRDAVADDVGYGIGQSYISFADAHESATKEAVTDAMKRCFRSFGNAFGNCLYDKVWLHDKDSSPPKATTKKTPKAAAKPQADDKGTKQELWDAIKKAAAEVNFELPKDAKEIKSLVTFIFDFFEVPHTDYRKCAIELGTVTFDLILDNWVQQAPNG